MELIIEDRCARSHKIDANSDQPRCNTGRSSTWALEKASNGLRIIIEDDTITVIAGGRSQGGTRS